MKNKFAWVVSRVFDPIIEIPLLLSTAVWIALTNGLRFRFLIMMIVVDALLPATYMFYGLKKGFISDWDMTRRKERGGLYFFTLICHLFGVVAAYAIGKYFLFQILLVFWSLAVVFAIVTLFWKISVHAGVNAALLAFFNHFYGWDKYWWLTLVLVLVIYSRVIIKKHTWAQVLVGSAVALIWVSLGLTWLSV